VPQPQHSGVGAMVPNKEATWRGTGAHRDGLAPDRTSGRLPDRGYGPGSGTIITGQGAS
jgi:hypothetical protein